MNIEYIEKNTDKKIEYHETISSTNDRAKKIAEENWNEKKSEKIQIVMTENQTNGRGTNGRVWLSQKEKNILMTLIFYPKNTIQEIQKITYSIAKMIQSAIQDLYDISLEIQLPNDLYLNGKKICGILTESSIQNEKINYLLIGIGFNVNQIEFPKELKEIATSLKQEYPELECKREEIIVKIVNQIKSLIR